ncbi:MAG: efflux RND transporter periplasmic adaptor subunit [Acidobacteria bacterium]|nr:efflux RND transporter periplasmic adaptor subunit [Acidobacteriota bacterium]
MKRTLALFMILALISLLFVGCSQTEGKKIQADKDAKKADNKETGKEEEKKDEIPVEITTITKGQISSYQLYNSTIEAEESVDVYNKVSGIILKLNVEEGMYVKAGTVLANIEDLDYKLSEASAKSSYEKAQREYDRSAKMYSDKLLSEKEYEQVKYNYEQSKIDWEKAKVQLNYTNIKAPISGIISSRYIKNGDYLPVNTKLFSIVDMETLITKVYIPEKDISGIKLNQKSTVTSDALKERTYYGYIKRISPVIDPDSGTVKVTVGLQDYDKNLRPGMFVKCHIITDTHKDTLLITKKAVIYNGIQSIIFVVRDGIANQITLDTGFQDSENIEALNKNLKAGDKIITVGQYGLKDKTPVKIIPGKKS